MTESPSPPTMFFSRHTKRREFIGGLAGAAVWPVVARGQQPAMPIVGFINSGSPLASWSNAFRKGLNETGYVEGQNVMVEYQAAGPIRPAAVDHD